MPTEVRVRYTPVQLSFEYTYLSDLRTALIAYLVAKSNQGKLILRIDSMSDESNNIEKYIFCALKTVGLVYDEGPDIGGNHAPYIQLQRKSIYMNYAKRLVDLGEAYYCFCSHETPDIPAKYDRRCLKMSKEKIEKRLADKEPFVIRHKTPDIPVLSFHDIVYGDITVDRDQLDDQVLIKSNGDPTYALSSVVDDHLMEITHVVRENDFLSITLRHILLYKSFGWTNPLYIHIPNKFIDPRAGQLTLYRRIGRLYDPFFEDLIEDGYLVQAIVNYIALLGWNPGNKQEIFSLKDLEQVFSIDRIGKSSAYFDYNKLKWFNKEYIKRLSFEEFHELAKPYYKESIMNKNFDLLKISNLLKSGIDVLNDIPSKIDFLDKLPEYDKSIYNHTKFNVTEEKSFEILNSVLPVMEKIAHWSNQTIYDTLKILSQQLDVKIRQVLWPIRMAAIGKSVAPGETLEIVELLGKDETIRRIKIGIDVLSILK